MLYEYLPSFVRDTKKASEGAQIDLKPIIAEIKRANNLSDISNVKKMKGYVQTYRIKCGNYRVGFYFENETIILAKFLPRKNIYKYFP